MSKIISIASQKGGVGKTTTALNLGYSLSRLGESVLILDGDPQGGIAIASNLRKRTDKGLIDVLRNIVEPREVVMTTRDNSLSIAGVGTLEQEDVVFMEDPAAVPRIAEAISTMAEGFRYVIVDVPAGVGNIVTSLLGASHGVILTVGSRALSVKSIPSFLKLLEWVSKNLNESIHLTGILFSMVNSESEYESRVLEDVRNSFPAKIFFDTIIPFDELFERASMRAVPVSFTKGGAKLAEMYMNLALEVKIREREREIGGEIDEESEGLF